MLNKANYKNGRMNVTYMLCCTYIDDSCSY
jgi:hypothetical protein